MKATFWNVYHCEQGCGHHFMVEYPITPFHKEKAVSCPICGRTDFKFIECYEMFPFVKEGNA